MNFIFNQKVSSDDHCISGVVVFNEDGDACVAYYEKKKVKIIKMEYNHDWVVPTVFKKRIIPPPPSPPLDIITREGSSRTCNNCGSSVTKDGFAHLFGELLCDNPDCPNSKSRKRYH